MPKWIYKYQNYLLLGLILVITVGSYWPVFHNGFVWDDEGYILNNQLIKALDLKSIFSGYVMGNYHPLTILALAVEYRVFGLNATGYHAVNLLFHLLNVVLVFLIASHISRNNLVALITALLFGIHPLHVESVAWATGLKDLLYSFFFLLSWFCYLKYFSERHKRFYVFAFVSFLLSLLSKAMAVSLPLILLLSDYLYGRKMNKTAWLEKVPFFLLSVVFGIIAIIAQKSSGSIPDVTFPFFRRIIFASYGYITYLIKLVFPVHLSAFYPYQVGNTDPVPFMYYAYPVLCIALAAIAFISLRFSRKIFFGLGFFTLTVFLVLQLLPVGRAIMADRYSYIPSIGILFLAGEGFEMIRRKNLNLVAVLLISAFVIFFSVSSYARCGIWKNDITLWNDVINQYEKVPSAYLNRGIAYARENNYDKAIEDISKAIQLDMNNTNAFNNGAKAYYNRGNMYASERKFDMALKDFDKCIELNPKYKQAYFNRGNIYSDRQEYGQAMADFSKAIELDPGEAKPYLNRGFIYGIRKEYVKALDDFDRAISLDPGNADAFFNKGYVLILMANYSEAIRNLTQSVRIRPNDPAALFYRGQAAYYSGNREAALADLRQAAGWGYKPAEELMKAITGSQK
jgi:tetratricopeptide (TPR) repeat protein